MPSLCQYCGVEPKVLPKHRCAECLELKLTMSERQQKAMERRALVSVPVERVPASAWPAGRRFCSSCQSFRRVDRDGLKLDVGVNQSRCRPCISMAVQQTKFKITPEQLMGLQVIQQARCATCGKLQQKKSLATEHSHFTGDVRGLACLTDNQIIGELHDDPQVFVAIACYLIDPVARRVGIGGSVMSNKELEKKVLELVRNYRDRLGYTT